MDLQNAKSVIEALIFSAREPLTPKRIREILGEEEIKEKAVDEIVRALNEEYEREKRGFRIFHLNGGYEFRTSPEFGRYIEELYNMKKTFRLSKSVLETLAIIAYNQPVTRVEIEMIRSVNVSYILNKLLELELIKVMGQKETPGRPLLYGTTGKFLEYFGINSLDELPEISEVKKMVE